MQERLGDVVAGDHRAERRVGRADALGGGDHVGLVAEAFAAEPVARGGPTSRSPRRRSAARRGGRRSRARAGSSRPGARSSRRRSAPARGSPPRPSRGPRTRSPPRSRRPPTAGRGPRSSGRSWCWARACRPGVSGSKGSRSGRQAGRRQRAHRGAVVGEVARDRACGAAVRRCARVVGLRELPRRLDRLRAAGGEEHAVEVARRELGDARGQLDRARVRVAPVRVEAELLRLRGRRLARARRGRGRRSRSTAPRARRGSACRARRRRSSPRRGRSPAPRAARRRSPSA